MKQRLRTTWVGLTSAPTVRVFTTSLTIAALLLAVDATEQIIDLLFHVNAIPQGWSRVFVLVDLTGFLLLLFMLFSGSRLKRSIQVGQRSLAARVRTDEDAQRKFAAERAVIQDLLRSIDGVQIVLQPIVDIDRDCLDGECIVGHEALARFASGSDPAQWFATAARVHLGVELEMHAIGIALQVMPPTGYLSVNASPATMISRELFDAIFGLSEPERIVIELTEHVAVPDYPALIASIKRLRRLGVRLAIDDAGSGVSSLTHVVTLEPDLIKLDRALVVGIDTDPVRQALASTLKTFATNISARVVAEGVETLGELDALKAAHISFAQGYLLGKPRSSPTSHVDVERAVGVARALAGSRTPIQLSRLSAIS